MGKSRSVTPSNTRIKRDKSSAWPQTAMSTAKRSKKQVGSSRSLKRKRAPSPSPSDDGSDRADAMSIDKDTDDSDDETAPLDPLHAISIGHLILDDPGHRMYQQHVAALLNACGTGREGNAQLVEFTRHIHAKAEELDLLGDGETAAAAMTSAYCDRIATRLAESLASEEMLVEVTAMVLKRRAYDVDNKAFLRSLKRRLEGTTGVQREREPSAMVPEVEANPELLEVSIARAVDLYWDRERLGHLDNRNTPALVSSVIKCARDLFVVHQVVDAEFRAREQSQNGRNCRLAEQSVTVRATRPFVMATCVSWNGGEMPRDKSIIESSMDYVASDWAAQLPANAIEPTTSTAAVSATDITYVPVKSEPLDSPRQSLQHFVTAPTASHSGFAAVNGDRRIPCHTNSEMGERQDVLDRHGNQPAVHIDPAFRRPPPTGPSANGAVLVRMDSVPTITQMQQLCEQSYRRFGYVSVQRLSRTEGSSEWVVLLRTAGQDENAVRAQVKVYRQLGDIELYRGDLT
ncbi:hypothetical protein LTR17_000120 [Elasticomyces elasticus]|nr:hypothetical protein LTR17_000120 [Elasticomyces elasticus]